MKWNVCLEITEMFVPNVTCVVVLNHVPQTRIVAFHARTRLFFWGIFFSANDENTPPFYAILLPLSAGNLSFCLKSVPSSGGYSL